MSAGPAIKPRDAALIALIAAAPVKRITPKVVKAVAKGDGRIVMSRVAAKPVTAKVTEGFRLSHLSDRDRRWK